MFFPGGRSGVVAKEGGKVERRFADRPRRRHRPTKVATVLRNPSTQSGARICPANLCSGRKENSENPDRDSSDGHAGRTEDHCRGRRLAEDVSISGINMFWINGGFEKS